MVTPRTHPDDETSFPDEIEAVLRENDHLVRIVFQSGSAAHPSLPLPYEVFARRLVGIVHRRPLGDLADTGPGHFMRRLSRVAGPEIFLAIACEERVPGAWEVFTATHAADLREASFRHRSPGTDSQEIADGLIGDLFSPPASGDAGTRIGTWDGSGPLGAWLLAVLRNRFLDARRSAEGEARRRQAAGRMSAPGAAEPSGDDPALSAEAREERFELERRLHEAWETLSPGEMLALTLKFRDGRPQTEIASLLGVGEPRVSRIIVKGLRKLRDRLGDDLSAAVAAGLTAPW